MMVAQRNRCTRLSPSVDTLRAAGSRPHRLASMTKPDENWIRSPRIHIENLEIQIESGTELVASLVDQSV